MNWQNLRLNIVLRAVILTGFALLFAFLWVKTPFVIVTFLSGLSVIAALVELILKPQRSGRIPFLD